MVIKISTLTMEDKTTHMKIFNVLSLEEDTIAISYHQLHVKPGNVIAGVKYPDEISYCDALKPLAVDAQTTNIKSSPSHPMEAEDRPSGEAVAKDISSIKLGESILQGPWESTTACRAALEPRMEETFPELDLAFRFCSQCLV